MIRKIVTIAILSTAVLITDTGFAWQMQEASSRAPVKPNSADTDQLNTSDAFKGLTLTDNQKLQINLLLQEQSDRLKLILSDQSLPTAQKRDKIDLALKEMSDRIRGVLSPQNNAGANPSGQQNAQSSLPSAPSSGVQSHYDLRPGAANYSKSAGVFPLPVVYSARSVPPPSFANKPRIEQLITDGKLMLGLNDAIALALENNLDLAIARYNLDIADTDILRSKSGSAIRGVSTGIVSGTPGGGGVGATGAAGGGPGGTSAGAGGIATGAGGIVSTTTGVGPQLEQLDPILAGTLRLERATTQSTDPFSGTPLLFQNTSVGNFGYTQGFLPGTDITVDFNNLRTATNSTFSFFNPTISTSLRFQIRQHLLSGFGVSVNKRFIVLAKNNRMITDSAFRLQVIVTVSQIENIYWDLVSAFESQKAAERALTLAQQLVADNRRQVEIGTLAPIEITNAQAQASARTQDLIVAQTNLQYQQLLMKNAISRNLSSAALQTAVVIPTDTIDTTPRPEESIPIDDLVKQALAQRPEIEQANIDLQSRNINRRSARNGLRPVVDLFGFYGAGTIAGPANPLATICPPGTRTSFCVPAGFPSTGYFDAFRDLFNSTAPDKGGGINIQIPIRNRAAQADQIRSELEYHQAELRLEQLTNQIRIQVRNGQYALQQDRARVQSAMEAREFARQSLEAEEKKYKVGVSTNFNVMTQQSNLAAAENALISAMAAYAKDRVLFDQVLSDTLARNNINIQDAAIGEVRTLPVVPNVIRNPEIPQSPQP